MTIKRNNSPKRGQGFGSAPSSVEPEPIKVCIDVAPPPELLRLAADLSVAENIENAPKVPFGAPSYLAAISGNKWQPGRTLRCCFIGQVDPTVSAKIIAYAKQWETWANLKIQFVTDPLESEIRISVSPGGSWSYIGTSCLAISKSSPTMNFGWLKPTSSEEEYSRVVLHEFGHALGCIHEHQNPVVQIPWDVNAVYKYYMGSPNYWSKAQVDNNIFSKYSSGMTQFSNWDSKSIMHYAIPKELTGGQLEIPWNTVLSEIDKSFIGQIYPGVDPSKAELYASKLYRVILNRKASQPELDAVASAVVAHGRNVVVINMERSAEHTNIIAQNFYSEFLRRSPTPADALAYHNAINKGVTEEQLICSLLASDEFYLQVHGNPEEYVVAVFNKLLGRPPREEEVGPWARYVALYGRYKVASDICNTPERRSNLVKAFYQKVLNKTPSLSDSNYWVNSQLDVAKIRQGIEASAEFYNK